MQKGHAEKATKNVKKTTNVFQKVTETEESDLSLDGRNRAIVIAESLARVVAAIGD